MFGKGNGVVGVSIMIDWELCEKVVKLRRVSVRVMAVVKRMCVKYIMYERGKGEGVIQTGGR